MLQTSSCFKAKRSNIIKRFNNLYDKICEYGNLELAFKKASRGKHDRNVVIEVENNLENKLQEIQNMLINQTYSCSKYKIKKIYEPKERTIYILPFFPDRIIQHAVMNILEPIFESMFYENSYACRKGKGQHRASKKCMQFARSSKYCLQCDISKFYPSMDHNILKKLLERKFKDKRLLKLFFNTIDSVEGNRNIPIGNYISQWFGNYYMTEIDRYCYEVLKCRKYLRYCDDFILFSNSKSTLRKWKESIEDFLSHKLNLILSKSEIYPVSQGIDIVGYRHFHNKILLRKSTAKRIKKRMSSLMDQLNKNYITLDTAMGKAASAKGWLSHAQTYNLQLKIDIFNIWDKLMELNSIKRYSEFKKPSHKLEGDKLTVSDIINKEIILLAYRQIPSKIKEASFCIQMQFKFPENDKLYIAFTNSKVLRSLLEEVKEEIPFLVTIKKERNYYIFA